MSDLEGISIKNLEKLQKIGEKDKRHKGNKGKISDIKREIRKEIEDGVFAINIGMLFDERQVATLMIDKTMHLHNKHDAGNNDIDITKLIHEVFCSLFCEYLEYTESTTVRYYAWYIRNPKTDNFVDYIGFKF